MKKLLGVLVALGALAYGGVAFHTSQRAHDVYQRSIHAFAQHPDVRLLASEYTRGWSRSHGSLSFELLGPAGEQFGARLREAGAEEARHRVGFHLEHRIEHGVGPVLRWLRAGATGAPVVAHIRADASFDRESAAELERAFGEPPPLHLEARVRTSGVGEATLRMPRQALRSQPEEGVTPFRGDFHGLRGEGVFTTDGRTLAGSLESPGLEGGAGEKGLDLGSVSFRFDLARASVVAPWSGRSELAIGHLDTLGGTDFRALHVVEDLRIVQGLETRIFQATLERLAPAEGSELGPGRLELVLRGTPRRGPEGEPERVASLEGVETSGAGPLGRLLAALPPLVSAGTEAELRTLELATPEGPLEARGHLRATPPAPELVPTPLAVMAGVELFFEARAPEPLLQDGAWPSLAADLAGLRERGLVRVQDGVLEARLELRRGVLRAHGEEVPLAPLLGLPAVADASAAVRR